MGMASCSHSAHIICRVQKEPSMWEEVVVILLGPLSLCKAEYCIFTKFDWSLEHLNNWPWAWNLVVARLAEHRPTGISALQVKMACVMWIMLDYWIHKNHGGRNITIYVLLNKSYPDKVVIPSQRHTFASQRQSFAMPRFLSWMECMPNVTLASHLACRQFNLLFQPCLWWWITIQRPNQCVTALNHWEV